MKNVEDIKCGSSGLRGGISQALAAAATHFSEEDLQLLKFHGSYQQDDRDARNARRQAGLEKAWQFMVRSKIPGGDLSAGQYLVHDRMADELANGTIRLTNRQGIQMHGVLSGTLKECIRRINACGLTTWGACGDIVRNTMASATPLRDPVHQEVQRLAGAISKAFYASSHGYSEIWLDDERVSAEPDDPIYGTNYLPRKFKIGVAVPPRNDIDVFTQDAGLVPHIENGSIAGYTIFVGGSFGMSHGQFKTRPALSQPLFYVAKDDVITALQTIVAVQREYGRRDDRKQARLKYLILEKGIAWFRQKAFERMTAPVQPAKEVRFDTVEDQLGWHEQGDGRLFCGLWIPEGRIRDSATGSHRSAIRKICRMFLPRLRITPNCNLFLYDIAPESRAEVDTILRSHGVQTAEDLTRARRMAHACVALPTCGLALAESERVFSATMEEIDRILIGLGLAEEPILFRMSGCPNGCPRPYNADFALVGRSPGKYALFIGGSHRGDRLAWLQEKSIRLEDIPAIVRPYLADFASQRTPGETFSDYIRRSHPEGGEEPTSEQFHVELAERALRKNAETAARP